MACAHQGCRLIEKLFCPRYNLFSPKLVVTAGAFRTPLLRDRISPVEGVIEAAPAGIGGVERVAGIGGGNHQLRTRDAGDLVVHTIRRDYEGFRFGTEVVDLSQESLITRRIGRSPLERRMIAVNPALEVVANGEQLAVARCEDAHQPGNARPKCLRGDASPQKDLLFDEIKQNRGDLEAVRRNVFHTVSLMVGRTLAKGSFGEKDRSGFCRGEGNAGKSRLPALTPNPKR